MDAHELTLATVMKGTVPEMFAVAAEQILANIADPNTSATAARTLHMEFTFKPFPDRSGVSISLKPINPKLAGLDASEMTCSVYIVKRDGKYVGFVRDVRQELLFSEEKEVPTDGKTAGVGD